MAGAKAGSASSPASCDAATDESSSVAPSHTEFFSMLDNLLSPRMPSHIRVTAATAAAAQTAGAANAQLRRAMGGTSEGHAALRRLQALTADTSAARLALTTLINVSEEESAALYLISRNAISRAMDVLLDNELDAEIRPLLSLHCAILSNLTRFARGREKLTESGVASLNFRRTLSCASRFSDILWMANAGACENGRALLLQSTSESGRCGLEILAVLLGDAKEERRYAAACAIRNCAMAEDIHEQVVKKDVRVLGNVLSRFVCAAHPLDSDELMLAEAEVRDAAKKSKESGRDVSEPVEEIRHVLAEALLLLCKSRTGRNALRECSAYAVLKNWHLEENSERVKETLEGVVDRTKLLYEDEDVDAELGNTA